MGTPATFLVGCGGFRPTSCRFLRLTAPILGALCGGIHNRDCSCARVTAAHIMPMAAAPRVHHLAVFSNTTTNWKPASFGSKPVRYRRWHPLPARPAPINRRGAHAPDQRPRRLV